MDKNTVLATTVKGIDEATKDIRAFINGLVDSSSFVETDTFLSGKSLLDGSEAIGEGIVTGYASLDGRPVCVIAQNAAVLGGSFGIGQAKKIIKCMDNALKNNHTIISVLDSKGARVGEGVTCLEGYAMVLAKAAEVSANVPHIVIAKGNVIGHMAAYLSMGDFVFAGKDCLISLNSPSVLAANVTKPVKELFGLKTHSKDTGIIDFVYADIQDLKNKITLVLDYTGEYSNDCDDDPNRETATLENDISVANLLAALTDEGRCLEYAAEYSKEIKCYFARVNGVAVGIIASDTSVNEYMTLDGAEKITAFANLLDAYDLPLVTLVNCKGISTKISDEQSCAVCGAGKLINIIASLSIPSIAVVVGNAIG
ncbi:MAG: hypothetical protein EOM87_08725, partial [Clostridia bacterium]|nr:hypothetical protein [Clostridia bacterium]